ncbi:MAG TPA: phosphatase PAP2 family protein [bacterium]|nr:phosphatase PAP2 family protein [bacterium]HPQ19718.1 phosphatase PAP2 family protein [bacterium]
MEFRNILKSLNIIDRLFVIYQIIIILFILIFYPQISNNLKLLLFHLVILFLLIVFIKTIDEKKNKLFFFIRYIYPLILLTFFYIETAQLNKTIFKTNFDKYLAKIDDWIFGFQPALKFYQNFNLQIFQELISVGYLYYYFIIPLTAYYFLRNQSEKLFVNYLFNIFLSFFIYYIFFIIFPTEGPHKFFSVDFIKAYENGFIFTRLVKFIEQNIEVPTGAFPSSHIGIGFITILYLFKYVQKRKIYLLIHLCLFFLMCCATIYIGAHFFIDIPFGFISGGIFYIVNNKIFKRLILSFELD